MLTKAQEASDANLRAGARDKIATEVMASYGNNGKIDVEQLNINLKENIKGITHDEESLEDNPIEGLPANVELDGFKFRIEEKGEITDLGKSTPPVVVNIPSAEEAGITFTNLTWGNKIATEQFPSININYSIKDGTYNLMYKINDGETKTLKSGASRRWNM